MIPAGFKVRSDDQ